MAIYVKVQISTVLKIQDPCGPEDVAKVEEIIEEKSEDWLAIHTGHEIIDHHVSVETEDSD